MDYAKLGRAMGKTTLVLLVVISFITVMTVLTQYVSGTVLLGWSFVMILIGLLVFIFYSLED